MKGESWPGAAAMVAVSMFSPFSDLSVMSACEIMPTLSVLAGKSDYMVVAGSAP